jgi:hypothetical protein
MTKDDKRQSYEDKRKAEEKLKLATKETRKMEETMNKAKEDLELATQATRKMKEAMEKAEQKAKIGQEATQKVEEAMKNIVEENMRLELQLADIVYDHKLNANATRKKMKAIKRYALDRETYLQYALGANVILFTLFIAMFRLLRCMR